MKNQIEVIDNKRKGMRISRGETVIDFSPEATEKLCSDLIALGTEFVSETSKMTIEYFQTQSNMYYAQLNAYISNQTTQSQERYQILQVLQTMANEFQKLILEAEDKEKINILEKQYELNIEALKKLYSENLGKSSEQEIPKKPSLFKGLKELFFKG